MDLIELPGDVLRAFRQRERLSARTVARDTGWGTEWIVYNLESITVSKTRKGEKWRARVFFREAYEQLLRAYPSRLRPSSEWPSRFERALERQSYFLVWGRDVLEKGWKPPLVSSWLSELEVEQAVRSTILEGSENTQGLRAALQRGEPGEALRVVQEAMYIYSVIVRLLRDSQALYDDGRIMPDNVDTRGDQHEPDQRGIVNMMIAISRAIADQFRLDAEAGGLASRDLTEAPD